MRPVDLYESLVAPPPDGMRPALAGLAKKVLAERANVFRGLTKYEREHPED